MVADPVDLTIPYPPILPDFNWLADPISIPQEVQLGAPLNNRYSFSFVCAFVVGCINVKMTAISSCQRWKRRMSFFLIIKRLGTNPGSSMLNQIDSL